MALRVLQKVLVGTANFEAVIQVASALILYGENIQGHRPKSKSI